MRDAAAASPQLKTFVWFNYRRCPAVALARQLVQDGRLGRIYHVRARYLQDWGGPDTPLLWRFQGNLAGSGALGDLGAHSIDLARFILGDDIVEVTGAALETFIKQRRVPDESSAPPGANAHTAASTVDDAAIFLTRFSGGALASFEATRLSTGDKNANQIEIHGQSGALRFHFERMNELQWFDATLDPKLQGWSTIQVTDAAAGHPYAAAWWPPGHVIGYEHGFINQVADMLNVLAGKEPAAPLPDFADAYETQRVMTAVQLAARERTAIPLTQVK